MVGGLITCATLDIYAGLYNGHLFIKNTNIAIEKSG
jgi:hypothetical protein